jgi:hypothetical protein
MKTVSRSHHRDGLQRPLLSGPGGEPNAWAYAAGHGPAFSRRRGWTSPLRSRCSHFCGREGQSGRRARRPSRSPAQPFQSERGRRPVGGDRAASLTCGPRRRRVTLGNGSAQVAVRSGITIRPGGLEDSYRGLAATVPRGKRIPAARLSPSCIHGGGCASWRLRTRAPRTQGKRTRLPVARRRSGRPTKCSASAAIQGRSHSAHSRTVAAPSAPTLGRRYAGPGTI